MENKKKIIGAILSIIILVASLIFGVILVKQIQKLGKKAATTNVNLTMSPAVVEQALGTTFSVDQNIDTGGQTVSAVEVHITYDNTKLEATNVVLNNYFPVVLQNYAVSNGEISYVVASNPDSPINGSGLLSSVTFKILAESNNSILYSNQTQASAIGQTTNAVGGMIGTNIVFATPSPSPTPTQSSQPSATATVNPTETPTTSPDATTTSSASDAPTATATSTSGYKTGDINRDGLVNIVDIGIIIDYFNTTPPGYTNADLNNDNIINIVDIGIVIDNLD